MLDVVGRGLRADLLDVAGRQGVAEAGGELEPGLFAVATVYEGGWISNYNTAYNVDQAAVSEDVSITVSDVFDISGSVYGEFIDSGLNAGDVTGHSIRYSKDR